MTQPIQTYTKTAYEIFEEIDALKTKKERVDAVREISKQNEMIAHLLVFGFNDYITNECILPDSVPTQMESEKDTKGMYLPSSEESHPTNLIKEYKNCLLYTSPSPRD